MNEACTQTPGGLPPNPALKVPLGVPIAIGIEVDFRKIWMTATSLKEKRDIQQNTKK